MPSVQRGQVFKKASGAWAYHYYDHGRRQQVGGFRTKGEASRVLDERLRRLRPGGLYHEQVTLAELVERYLAQHQVDPATIRKLRSDLRQATRAFGDVRLEQLVLAEIASWRASLSPGARHGVFRSLKQVLAQAVAWRMI